MVTMSIEQAVTSFRARLASYRQLPELDRAAAEALGRDAADFAAARELLRDEVAGRIGPVYDAEQLARWLTPAGQPLTSEAVRKRAKLRQLVAFQTSDRSWVFPAWQFDVAGGVLVPHPQVTALWRALPHGRWMSAANLAVWMHTRSRTLRDTPASVARRRSAEDPALRAVVARLHARVDGVST